MRLDATGNLARTILTARVMAIILIPGLVARLQQPKLVQLGLVQPQLVQHRRQRRPAPQRQKQLPRQLQLLQLQHLL